MLISKPKSFRLSRFWGHLLIMSGFVHVQYPGNNSVHLIESLFTVILLFAFIQKWFRFILFQFHYFAPSFCLYLFTIIHRVWLFHFHLVSFFVWPVVRFNIYNLYLCDSVGFQFTYGESIIQWIHPSSDFLQLFHFVDCC